MDFHVLTLFPEMVENTVQTSITGRAVKKRKNSPPYGKYQRFCRQ